jgi:hypothetical protein
MSPNVAWALVRVELATAVVACLAGPFLFIAAPGYMEPMFHGDRTPETLLGIGAVLVIWLATAWMFAIWRRDPEGGAPAWRYRA